MDLDLKSVSVLLGIASTVATLAFKLMPRSADRLKRDLELLKLAREANANHLPLQRHVDAQILEEYVRAGLSLRRRLDILFGNLLFAMLILVPIMTIVGLAVAFGAGLLFSLSEDTTSQVVLAFVGLGAIAGLLGGITEAHRDTDEVLREIQERERLAIEEDQETLRRASARADA
jgi:hypothetical protein